MDLDKRLLDLGLSDKEAAVYLAALGEGKSPIGKIALRARINRTTAYDIVVELERKGLMVKAMDAKSQKMMYAPEPPAKMTLLLEKRLKDLEQKVQVSRELSKELDFIAQKQPGKPTLKLFQGKDGVKELYETSLTSRGEIRSWNSVESLEAFDRGFMRDYFKRRAAKNIDIKAIINDGPLTREAKQRDNRERREIRIVPTDKMDIGPEVYVYDNVVSIFSLKEEFGVQIESAEIATAFRKLYDLAWERAKQYDERLDSKERPDLD